MTVGGRPYRGMAAETRRAARRARLLEAGLDLMGTQGWSRTTVTAICARARLTERYFYESFSDREELLVAVFDSIADEVARVALDAIANAPDDARAKGRAAIAALVELLTDDPRKGRVALMEAFGSPALQRRRIETLDLYSKILVEQSRAFFGARAPSTSDMELTAHVLLGGLTELLIAWLGGRISVSTERMIDHTADLFAAMAGVTQRARSARGSKTRGNAPRSRRPRTRTA